MGHPTDGPLRGAVVFVPRGVPGDIVTCRVTRSKKRWARAEIVRIERRSPWRREVPCSVQARCGGCPWMTGAPEVQASSRLAILRGEAQKRLGWDEATAAARVGLAETDGAPALGYRCRVRMAWRVDAGGRARVGYRAPRSHRLVPALGCVIASAAVREALPAVVRELEARGPGEGEVLLLHGSEGVAVVVRPTHGEPWRSGPGEVTVGHDGHEVTARADTFVQTNPVVAATIAAAVEAEARALGAPGRALELFCGVGTLTLPLLRAGWSVTGYESARRTSALFERNTAAWADRAAWVYADLLEDGGIWPPPRPAPELVLLDPPRVGAAPLIPWLRALPARRIVMVSCDVSTAMRDIAGLVEGDRWRVRDVTGYNMFPHTGHQELICVLEPGAQSEQL